LGLLVKVASSNVSWIVVFLLIVGVAVTVFVQKAADHHGSSLKIQAVSNILSTICSVLLLFGLLMPGSSLHLLLLLSMSEVARHRVELL
jgi:hypothetical protein